MKYALEVTNKAIACAEGACKATGTTFKTSIYECPYEAEVNVILTDNSSIAVINEEYRGLPKPTDVLSFPLFEYDENGNMITFDPIPEQDFTWEYETLDIIVTFAKKGLPHRMPIWMYPYLRY